MAARVYHDSAEDKWLLRKFKEIPANVFHNQASRIAFMAQSHAEAHQAVCRPGVNAQGLRCHEKHNIRMNIRYINVT